MNCILKPCACRTCPCPLPLLISPVLGSRVQVLTAGSGGVFVFHESLSVPLIKPASTVLPGLLEPSPVRMTWEGSIDDGAGGVGIQSFIRDGDQAVDLDICNTSASVTSPYISLKTSERMCVCACVCEGEREIKQ